jgi:sulfocyanin
MWDNLVVSSAARAAAVSFSTAKSAGATGTTTAPSNPSQWIATTGKNVHLTLIAGYNQANAGFNFDGGANGHMVVTVPLGDKVTGTFKNTASTPHDVLVVAYQKPLPTHSVPVAFAGACFGSPVCSAGGTGKPGAGSPPTGGAPQGANQTGTFSFVASKAGTYMIICGYPGHAIAGMWDTLVVSPTAKVASIAFK